MPVVDTDVLTIIQRGTEPDYTRLRERLDALPAGIVVWTTIISFEEQLRGWLEYIKRAKPHALPAGYSKLHDLNQDFSTRPLLGFDSAAAREYETVRGLNTRVGAMDLKIAAIAIANGELLLSKNLRDFRKVPGLRVEDWTR